MQEFRSSGVQNSGIQPTSPVVPMSHGVKLSKCIFSHVLRSFAGYIVDLGGIFDFWLPKSTYAELELSEPLTPEF